MRLVDQVIEQLLALVQARGLQAGQRLPAERQLAEELGVSRTSLREAIQKLGSQGVLASRRGDGTYLCASVPADWLQEAIGPLPGLIESDAHYRYDVLEARHALESSTAWLAAQRATPQDKARIQHCFDVMLAHQQSGHAEQAAWADAQFHLAIAEASHNLVLVQLMQSLFAVLRSTMVRNRHDMFRHSTPQSLQVLSDQHRSLMQAILDGDAPRARSCIGDHIDHVRSTLQRMDEDRARRERSTRLARAVAPSFPGQQP
jgi:GntR family transcriptional regulator, L-lactate dehydrogenase operon regulator